jgi:hypothetical protein
MAEKMLFQFVGELVFAIIALLGAIFLLPFVTFGRVHIDSGNPPIKFPWHGVHRLPNGKIILQGDLAGLIGLLLVAAFVAIVIVAYKTFWQ